jgi:hypothetical protein
MSTHPLDPPLCFVKRGKLHDTVFFTPPLCEAERRMGGEFIKKREGQGWVKKNTWISS